MSGIPPRCYLFPTPGSTKRPTFLHETGGLEGNWALDFMAPGGSVVLSPVDGAVSRFSGHDPDTGVHGEAGDVFGWTIYLVGRGGYQFFLTHLGVRNVNVGRGVCRGETLARVGHWPNDPGRSHLHLGVTSPHGEADAKATVQLIAKALRLRPM